MVFQLAVDMVLHVLDLSFVLPPLFEALQHSPVLDALHPPPQCPLLVCGLLNSRHGCGSVPCGTELRPASPTTCCVKHCGACLALETLEERGRHLLQREKRALHIVTGHCRCPRWIRQGLTVCTVELQLHVVRQLTISVHGLGTMVV